MLLLSASFVSSLKKCNKKNCHCHCFTLSDEVPCVDSFALSLLLAEGQCIISIK